MITRGSPSALKAVGGLQVVRIILEIQGRETVVSIRRDLADVPVRKNILKKNESFPNEPCACTDARGEHVTLPCLASIKMDDPDCH